jgi:hypothetical protein
MKYMLLICSDPAELAGPEGQARIPEILAKHGKLAEELNAAGVEWTGARLQPSGAATTVRTNGGGQTLHDGPFAETKEELGGYYLIDVADLDAAIGWARKIPMPGQGSVEVRPLWAM